MKALKKRKGSGKKRAGEKNDITELSSKGHKKIFCATAFTKVLSK